MPGLTNNDNVYPTEQPVEPKVDPKVISNKFTEWMVPLIQQLIDNKLILFVKEVRSLTGLGLKEAKDLSDDIFRLFVIPVRSSTEANRIAMLERDITANHQEIVHLDRRVDELIDEKVRLQDLLNEAHAARDNEIEACKALEGDLQATAERLHLTEKLLRQHLPE